MPKVLFSVLLILLIVASIGAYSAYSWYHPNLIKPFINQSVRQRNLTKYTFKNLSQNKFVGSQIKFENLIKDFPEYSSYQFSFTNDEGKKVTGLANIPKNPRPQNPVVLTIRGFVDKEIYTTGMGTKNAAGYFARNGFYTFGPDFLGYGDSDLDSPDILEARFEKPATVLSLMASLENHVVLNPDNKLPLAIKDSPRFIWAHSNGGQISLSVLEITQKKIPTTLWAPVSVGFPYSVNYFLGDYPDNGSYIVRDLKDFETRYKYDDYSIDKYFEQIAAPIQLHQGSRDNAVPQKWSDNLAETLLGLNLDLDYFVYPKSDHDMRPDWDTAIKRDLVFFEKHLSRSLSSSH